MRASKFVIGSRILRGQMQGKLLGEPGTGNIEVQQRQCPAPEGNEVMPPRIHRTWWTASCNSEMMTS